jgi:hypothetical protein
MTPGISIHRHPIAPPKNKMKCQGECTSINRQPRCGLCHETQLKLERSGMSIAAPDPHLASKIENGLQYPGQIRITVIRETSCVEVAK